MIAIHNYSDYGYYGKTGSYIPQNIPSVKTHPNTNDLPTLICEYDDTPGFRETIYRFSYPKKGYLGHQRGNLMAAVQDWNEWVNCQ